MFKSRPPQASKDAWGLAPISARMTRHMTPGAMVEPILPGNWPQSSATSSSLSSRSHRHPLFMRAARKRGPLRKNGQILSLRESPGHSGDTVRTLFGYSGARGLKGPGDTSVGHSRTLTRTPLLSGTLSATLPKHFGALRARESRKV